MHNRITDAEIFYLFGKASRTDAEAIFAALVTVEDLFTREKNRDQLRQGVQALLQQPQLPIVDKFIRRLLQADFQNVTHALRVAINHVFSATDGYISALYNHKKKARAKAQEVKQ
jgi:hypothetical protein